MRCKHGRQVNRAGALRSVKAPYALYGVGIHVHSLCAVAPARRNGKCYRNALALELCVNPCGLADTSDRGLSNYYLYGLAVGVAQILLEKLLCSARHVHRLLLERLTNLERTAASVDRRTDTDNRIVADNSFCHNILLRRTRG